MHNFALLGQQFLGIKDSKEEYHLGAIRTNLESPHNKLDEKELTRRLRIQHLHIHLNGAADGLELALLVAQLDEERFLVVGFRVGGLDLGWGYLEPELAGLLVVHSYCFPI